MTSSERMKVRAPELRGRRWLNTGGAELGLAELRGRIVVLDFWTFCCVNCLHALDELRVVEEEFGDVLTIIGVHSPKFVHEADPAAVEAAVERYGVEHPVLDDPELTTWDAYAARAWPTLAVIDPDGFVVARMAGEGHGPGLAALVRELIEQHGDRLRRGDGPYVPPPAPDTALRFPGKVVALPGGTYLVSDTAHHQLVELAADLETELRRVGDGDRGFVDGQATSARFSEPQGLLVLDASSVLVADTVNHAIRRVDLDAGTVSTLAGTGSQLRERVAPGSTATELSSPWDLARWDDRVVVAMAGSHQLWTLDPDTGTATVLAGTTNEGLRDGAFDEAFLAQPSGLAADGPVLWVADSEISALRRVVTDPEAGPQVGTAVGQGLFDFGHRDGPAAAALLQHPLGVAVLPDSSVAVADTYNGAVRRFDPSSGTVSTLAEGLAEPSDLLVDGETLIVVESAAHRLVRLPIPAGSLRGSPGGGSVGGGTLVDGTSHTVRRTPTGLGPGVALRIGFVPPAGQHLDDRFGDPTSLTVAADPPSLLRSGAGTSTGLTRELELDPAVGSGVLQVAVAAAACDSADGTAGTFAACHRYQQDWGIPVVVSGDGAATLELDLRSV
ncbi:NHL domain-containing thioredoxin family protein [Pseudonocardia parietis]|uniref:Thiol-disulfide isomerase/thioredoxin/sugar lactone lactonase YvrE n=1 Tax=Pseudonocardia parietis TaxID=570936 RepID=A0ABS4VTG7_9PSEU|nr:NHL domain-containing thioredoxin family protein [Pseudonocardia parietis]MBP2367206.1 thiol-disulfide isomerase/thioredoxin/sugar lactone lactonase YvrE [Pseudonocardia parietis]